MKKLNRGWNGAVVALLAAAALWWGAGRSGTVANDAAKAESTAAVLDAAHRSGARGAPRAASRRAQAASEAAAALHTRVVAELIAGLEEDNDWPSYQACMQAGADEPSCRATRADAIYGAIARRVMPAIETDSLGISNLIATHGQTAVTRALRAQAAIESEELPRIGVLLLLTSVTAIERAPLPPALYADLTSRLDVELDLIFSNHRDMPLPNAELAARVAELAVDPQQTDRARQHALSALAHAETAAELSNVIETWVTHGLLDEQLATDQVGVALSRCGARCADLIARLGASERPEARSASRAAIELVRDEERAEVLERLAAAGLR